MKALKKMLVLLLVLACLSGTGSIALASNYHTASGTASVCVQKDYGSSKKVWITPTMGKKYHKKSCRTIKNKYKVKMKLSEAKKKGYGRCKVCKP